MYLACGIQFHGGPVETKNPAVLCARTQSLHQCPPVMWATCSILSIICQHMHAGCLRACRGGSSCFRSGFIAASNRPSCSCDRPIATWNRCLGITACPRRCSSGRPPTLIGAIMRFIMHVAIVMLVDTLCTAL